MRYQTSSRGKNAVSELLAKSLQTGAAYKMKAVNPKCRIHFAEALFKSLNSCFLQSRISTFFFVTIVSDRHAMRCRDADNHDIKDHRAWISKKLDGFDFLGMIEIAYYPKAPFRPGGEVPWVSWHVHAIVWNATRAKIEKLKREINRDHQSFNPDRMACHYHSLNADDLESRVAYICKLPITEYNAYMTLASGPVDPATGIQTKVPTGRARQKKGELMPGDTVRALIAMGEQRALSLLCVAGGQGIQVRKETLDNACKFLTAERAKHEEKILRIYETSAA